MSERQILIKIYNFGSQTIELNGYLCTQITRLSEERRYERTVCLA